MEGESQIHRDGQQTKKKRHESSGSSCSTSGPLLLHGCSVSLPQKPVSLKRSLVSETSDDILNKKTRMYSRRSPPSKLTCGSPVPKHNSIRSSYRTTPGISQLAKKRGPISSLFTGSASSGSQQPERPAENTREEELGHDRVLQLLLLR
jgi:nuclear pore complex protein Nup121